MNLSINNFGKQYGCDLWGLSDFSLEISPGVLGLLGSNGAGISTLALALGARSGSNKLYEVVYMVLWFSGPITKWKVSILWEPVRTSNGAGHWDMVCSPSCCWRLL